MYEENSMDFCITTLGFESPGNRCSKPLNNVNFKIFWGSARDPAAGHTAPPRPQLDFVKSSQSLFAYAPAAMDGHSAGQSPNERKQRG